MPKSNLASLTPNSLCELMKLAGYRAEIVEASGNAPLLCSAAGGLPFELRFLNTTPGKDGGYADVMLTAGLRVPGELPFDLVNRWNSTKRFARLYLTRDYLVLAMDVVVLGGVSQAHLAAQLELWSRLLQELSSYLRGTAQGSC
jgi:Putative bacterial sensory transduction regulator